MLQLWSRQVHSLPSGPKPLLKLKLLVRATNKLVDPQCPPYCQPSNHRLNQKEEYLATSEHKVQSSNPFCLVCFFTTKRDCGWVKNCVDALIQKKENRKSQPVSSSASVFINEEDLPVENALVKEPNNRREVKSMLKNWAWTLNGQVQLRISEESMRGWRMAQSFQW